MNAIELAARRESDAARARFAELEGRPLFVSDWAPALFIHYELDPRALQPFVPFELDLCDGRAYVSLVAFTIRRLRPSFGGRLSEALFKPIATHEFLNVRTYVRHRGEPGIFFIAEWLSNPLSVLLGPISYFLPYRYGRIAYRGGEDSHELSGEIRPPRSPSALRYHGTIRDEPFAPCAPGSLDAFLLERYTAFTHRGPSDGLFRIWHEPWFQRPVEVMIGDASLIAGIGPWFGKAKLCGANFSPGARNVWIGRPRSLHAEPCNRPD